ncbi:MAG: GDP-L-fucose synthase [Gammaproteobacteria bacterium]|jgi:GDP-L-fucose synthase
MNTTDAIFVAGHRGLVGSAIVRLLEQRGYSNILTRTHIELDLTDQRAVADFFSEFSPAYVFMAAAKVGGIYANDTYPADFLGQNLVIQTNVIDAAYRYGTKKFLFLGSSCIYPKSAEQPIREDSLLTAPLEPTNEWYAIAKIAGIKMCQAYRKQFGFNAISAMPTNLYGPGDNFDLQNSHVLPALIRKIHTAKLDNESPVIVWGTGAPRREFLHVDDLADALLHLMENYDSEQIINVGVGRDLTIRELAELISEIVGYRGELEFDTSKPDGTPRKLLDVSRLRETGWEARIALRDGIRSTYDWYVSNAA